MSEEAGIWQVLCVASRAALEKTWQSRYWKPIPVRIILLVIAFLLPFIIERKVDKSGLLYGLLSVLFLFAILYVYNFVLALVEIDRTKVAASKWEELSILPLEFKIPPTVREQEKSLIYLPTREEIDYYVYSGKAIMRRLDTRPNDRSEK